jgi:hypothetical protein
MRRSVAGAQVRGVCESCNGGWMSDLENSAKPIIGPMIQGSGIRLDHPSQYVAATWLIKTELTLSIPNRIHRTQQSEFSRDYAEFFERPAPSDKYHVSVGAFSGEKWTTAFHFQPIVFRTKDDEPVAHAEYPHLSTILVGNLIAQVFHAPPQAIASLRVSGHRLRPVWPYTEEFIWPPGRFFLASELQRLANSNFPTLNPHPRASSIKWFDQ